MPTPLCMRAAGAFGDRCEKSGGAGEGTDPEPACKSLDIYCIDLYSICVSESREHSCKSLDMIKYMVFV